jgi:hypothetical protein
MSSQDQMENSPIPINHLSANISMLLGTFLFFEHHLYSYSLYTRYQTQIGKHLGLQ